MIWHGALQTIGTHQRLEPYQGDVRVITLYTHTFVLGELRGRADDREHPFYTATADSPENAEKEAYMVYLRAQKCKHDMKNKSPTLMQCRCCGIQQRVQLYGAEHASHSYFARKEQPAKPQASAQSAAKQPAAKPQRRLFGLF